MPLPPTITTRTYTGTIVGTDGTNATGTLEFRLPRPLYDHTNNVVVGPRKPLTATVTNGAFTTQIPVSDQPYSVRIDTDALRDVYLLLVEAGDTPLTFADTYGTAAAPDLVEFYALRRHTHPQTDITGLPAALIDIDTRLDALEGDTDTAGATLPLFNVETYGAVGDGVTDDYPAIRAAWDAMLASPVGGLLVFPRVAVYRVDASVPGRLTQTVDKARALFPLPMRLRNLTKVTYGVLGAGDPYVVRTADLGASPGQVFTASVLLVDYDTPFTWSPSTGLPSVIGAPDADQTDPVGNTFSNLHFTIQDMIIRQPPNPSLCAVNLEQVSTMRVNGLRVDVDAVLDDVPLPTHPTGCALLAPRSNNNVVVELDRFLAEGMFAGGPATEHLHARALMALRCRIAVHNRRPCSHPGVIDHLKIEQCTWGVAGYNPAAATADEAVVTAPGWTGRIGLLGIEDYANRGGTPGFYTPTAGAHVFDETGVLNGTVAMVSRVNSEPPAPNGIGIGPGGVSQSLYIRGPAGTTASPMAFFGLNHTVAATRLAPPSAPEVTEYSLFPAEDGPSTLAAEAAINIGVKVNFTAEVEITKLRFWRPTGLNGPITGRVWRFTAPSTWEAVSADVTFDLTATDDWLLATLPTPVPAGPGAVYVPTVHCVGAYPYTLSYWDSGPGGSGIINGPLRAFSNVDAGGQGCFSIGDISVAPTTSGGGTNYGVDLVVVDT